MPEVDVEEIVDHLSSEFKGALEETLRKFAPHATVDRNQLYKEFKRAIGRKCRRWESVPDRCVDLD